MSFVSKFFIEVAIGATKFFVLLASPCFLCRPSPCNHADLICLSQQKPCGGGFKVCCHQCWHNFAHTLMPAKASGKCSPAPVTVELEVQEGFEALLSTHVSFCKKHKTTISSVFLQLIQNFLADKAKNHDTHLECQANICELCQ